jgi:hypothetical protein
MFSVIYLFKIKSETAHDFVKYWKELTVLIKKHEGGLGSRLHKQNEYNYIGYAQWPDKETWGNSGNKLPDTANAIRKGMRACCVSVETLYELDVVADLLIHKKE